MIRPDNEMSLSSTSTSATPTNARKIGRREAVASAGASSVRVYVIFVLLSVTLILKFPVGSPHQVIVGHTAFTRTFYHLMKSNSYSHSARRTVSLHGKDAG